MNKSDVIFALKIFSLLFLLVLGYNSNKSMETSAEKSQNISQVSHNVLYKNDMISKIKSDATEGFFILTSRNTFGTDKKN